MFLQGLCERASQVSVGRPVIFATAGIVVLGSGLAVLRPPFWAMGELILAAACYILIRECTVVFQGAPSGRVSGQLRAAGSAGWFGGLADSSGDGSLWRGEERRQFNPEPDFASQWLQVYRSGDSASPSVDQIAHEMLAQAFRQAALEHHPDNGGDPENIRRVYAARELLLRALNKV